MKKNARRREENKDKTIQSKRGGRRVKWRERRNHETDKQMIEIQMTYSITVNVLLVLRLSASNAAP